MKGDIRQSALVGQAMQLRQGLNANERVDVRQMLNQGKGLLKSASEQLGGVDGLKSTATHAQALLQVMRQMLQLPLSVSTKTL
eukprot:SAG31_NODE_220_length_19925_cov_3.630939_7_plen_83_part_00